jgi:hypothetical protein
MTLVTPAEVNYLSPTEVCGIIWLSGAARTFSRIPFCFSIFSKLIRSRPSTKQELFNLQHAMLRNVIKRAFGILKNRFHILLLPPKYPLEVQIHIPAALSAIHNFICHYESTDDTHRMEEDNIEYEDPEDIDLLLRDRIADTMWDHYMVLRHQLDLKEEEDSELGYIDFDFDLDSDNSDGQYM